MIFDKEGMIARATDAMARAYAPYSNYRVGACAMADDGTLYTGCNVENASYGLTLCAERVAVTKMISDGKKRLAVIAIVGEKSPAWPCGACRQVINEFAGKEIPVIVAQAGGDYEEMTLGEIFPRAFGPEAL